MNTRNSSSNEICVYELEYINHSMPLWTRMRFDNEVQAVLFLLSRPSVSVHRNDLQIDPGFQTAADFSRHRF